MQLFAVEPQCLIFVNVWLFSIMNNHAARAYGLISCNRTSSFPHKCRAWSQDLVTLLGGWKCVACSQRNYKRKENKRKQQNKIKNCGCSVLNNYSWQSLTCFLLIVTENMPKMISSTSTAFNTLYKCCQFVPPGSLNKLS